MKTTVLIVGLLLTVILSAQITPALKPDTLNVKIKKEICGHFSVHMGTSVYEGICFGQILIPHLI